MILRRAPFAGSAVSSILSGLKLDRLIAKHRSAGRSAAHRMIAASRVRLDGVIVRDSKTDVDRFMSVELDGETVQQGTRALHIMVNKPVGVLSATADAVHRTVIDLIDHPDKATLHIAGRLDRGTSGLVLLTNDGRWSKRITDPGAKVPKVYQVETSEPISPDAVGHFLRGFHFQTENIHTLPAQLEITGERSARLTLHEGRYHQVKRMFHRVGNRVVMLHRESIGCITLAADFTPGQWRDLSQAELDSFR